MSLFDVTMGSFNGAEICELVGFYILHLLSSKFNKDQVGLYRDDSLAAFINCLGPDPSGQERTLSKHLKTVAFV